MPAAAPPSPQTGDTTTTGEPSCRDDSCFMSSSLSSPLSDSPLSSVTALPDVRIVDHTTDDFASPFSISYSPSWSWQGSGGTMSPPRLPWQNDLSMNIHGYQVSENSVLTDTASFKAVVQRLTGMQSSSVLPRSTTFPDAISYKTADSVITKESTHVHKGFAATPLCKREITEGVTGIHEMTERVGYRHEEIKGRVDDNHMEIVERVFEKHEIMELVLSNDPSNNRFSVICITGVDGLGKTSLASLVYYDKTICNSFEARAWLCLSDVCDYEELLRSAVASFTGVSCRLMKRDDIEDLLKEELMGKRFFLVMDNLCENNVDICKHLLLLLSIGDRGSAVVITTSSNMVAGNIGTSCTYKLRPLLHDSFLMLARPNIVDYSSPLERVLDKISSVYSGSPMLARAFRGMLYSACTQRWLNDKVESKLTEILSKPYNQLQRLLYLSYINLCPDQMMCFLYCSLFPRDYKYNKEKLLRLWMSQGLMKPKREENIHDHKDNCKDAFNELLHRSFFGSYPSSETMEQKYVMHELSSNLALSASGNKFFRAHDHGLHCIPVDVQHLSIIPKQCDSEIYFRSSKEFRDLSTFLLIYNYQLESTDNQLHVMDVKALDEFFRSLRCLKTLDLSHTDIKDLPESIGYITSLRFLGLNNTNIRRLPNSICNLVRLQTLELQNSPYLLELPNDIKSLTSLQSDKACNHIIDNVGDARGAYLAEKKLQKLSLEWCRGEDVESNDKMSIAEKVIDALKPNCLLGELNIKGYYGLKFPSWIAYYALPNLVSITLDNCYNCEKLPTLGVLPLLRYLFIQNLLGVRAISYEFCATDTIFHKSFPKLETLKLREMYNLENWYDVLDGDFPSLRSLSIERCPKLNSIPCFQSISYMSVQYCNKLNLPCLPSLQIFKVSNLKQRKCLALPSELRSVQILEVTCCDNLCSVDGLIDLQSLSHLKFRACPKLNFFQNELLPDTLETVDIHRNCYTLRNWRPDGFDELSDASMTFFSCKFGISVVFSTLTISEKIVYGEAKRLHYLQISAK
ncbi:hypothetical protein ABZP36_024089 [Zizania latifolia]